jgi:hypothetical protein
MLLRRSQAALRQNQNRKAPESKVKSVQFLQDVRCSGSRYDWLRYRLAGRVGRPAGSGGSSSARRDASPLDHLARDFDLRLAGIIARLPGTATRVLRNAAGLWRIRLVAGQFLATLAASIHACGSSKELDDARYFDVRLNSSMQAWSYLPERAFGGYSPTEGNCPIYLTNRSNGFRPLDAREDKT